VDAFPAWEKYSEEYFVQSLFPSLLKEKKSCSGPKTAITLSVHMDNSMCHNGHRVVDELRCLKILRASNPRYSLDIGPGDFWMFGDLKGKLKACHLQAPEQILTPFQELWDNITFKELQMAGESWRDWLRWITEDEREYYRKSQFSKPAISWTNTTQGPFSLLFGHPVL
jgi:hypothetical protein